jgi:hypothetical protein
MVDPYTILKMTALMPLLESVDLLVTFAQKRDVYICNFMVALKIAAGQLYTLYVDKSTVFSTDEFWAFKNLLDSSHSHIHIKWIFDLNTEAAQLVFVANGEKIWALHDNNNVDRDVMASLVSAVKTKCTCNIMSDLGKQAGCKVDPSMSWTPCLLMFILLCRS